MFLRGESCNVERGELVVTGKRAAGSLLSLRSHHGRRTGGGGSNKNSDRSGWGTEGGMNEEDGRTRPQLMTEVHGNLRASALTAMLMSELCRLPYMCFVSAGQAA